VKARYVSCLIANVSFDKLAKHPRVELESRVATRHQGHTVPQHTAHMSHTAQPPMMFFFALFPLKAAFSPAQASSMSNPAQ
jgi:hypothetical protein